MDLHDAALEAVKCAAEKHQFLRPIDYTIPDMVWLFTDASPTGTGTWVGQGPTRDPARPAVCHSRKLTPSQNTYPTHHQEALAIVEVIASFEYLLRNRCFTVVTDHKGLNKMMTQKGLSGRQQRWQTFLSQFDFGIEYQPGTEHFLVDYLSTIHERKPNCTDIMLRDPTSQSSKTDTLPDTPARLLTPTTPLRLTTPLIQKTPYITLTMRSLLPPLHLITLFFALVLNIL